MYKYNSSPLLFCINYFSFLSFCCESKLRGSSCGLGPRQLLRLDHVTKSQKCDKTQYLSQILNKYRNKFVTKIHKCTFCDSL